MKSAVLYPRSSFQDQQHWDDFLKLRGGKQFEWYAEWNDISDLLARHCGLSIPARDPQPNILVPGCGTSELPAQMYDAGFSRVTCIDFSKNVIREMLGQHVRSRPGLIWKVMDITRMQFSDHSFDVILDKGTFDAVLGERDEDTSSANSFLSEVARVLKPGGRYACVTLAERHAIELLLSRLRHGWEIGIFQVPQLSRTSISKFYPFLIVATKVPMGNLPLISLSLLKNEGSHRGMQMQSLQEVLERENKWRTAADLARVPLDNIPTFKKLHPGQRVQISLGGHCKVQPAYKALVMDAKQDYVCTFDCAVFFVPKTKAHEWLYSSEEGQWQIVESAKARRLLLVFLETVTELRSTALQNDLSPLVKEFFPAQCSDNVPYMIPDDANSERTNVEEMDSPLTGTMLVEDVLLPEKKYNGKAKHGHFRRLIFRRNPNLIQSEALLICIRTKNGESGHRRNGNKKNRSPKTSHCRQASFDEFKVDHSYLASSYHEGMISGLALIGQNFQKWIESQTLIRVMVIGLGAGLLPMFLYNHIPVQNITVVELDPVVGNLARRHFGFVEDGRMQLEVGDGVAAVKKIANIISSRNEEVDCQPSNQLQVLIVDADSSDPSDGLSCPPVEFLEENFLQSAKTALDEDGILIINVVSRAHDPHVLVDTNLTKIFEEVYSLEVDEDVNRVVFALPQGGIRGKDRSGVLDGANVFYRIATQFSNWGHGPNIKEVLKNLKRIK